MPRNVSAAARAYHKNWGIIMAGGLNNEGDCCSNNVTYTSSGEDFYDLTPVPEDGKYHCAAAINSSHLFVTGLGPIDNKSFMYSKWSNQWERLQDMPTGRRYGGCGVVRSANGSISVAVVGGLDITGEHRLNTVEIYSVEENSWTRSDIPYFSSVNF